mgnify:CR=1 FL=1
MKHKIIGIIIAVIFALGVAGSILVLTAPEKSGVRILSNGEVIYTFDLSTAEDQTIEIPCGDHHNTVEIKDHRIRVADADCPDRTCVRMGWLSSSAMPIVCLPHHLVIEYTDDSDKIDAVTR